MNDNHKPLSDSEIDRLRDYLAETARRRWLNKLIRTGAAWIAGVIITTAATYRSIADLVEWVTKK